MALDSFFTLYSAGCNGTNSSGVENFFGSYSGLSLLNQNDVIYIQISASVNEFFIAPSMQAPTNNIGYKVYPALSTIDLPPMRAGDASTFSVSRTQGDAASANNGSWNWVVWRRVPYSN